MAWTASIVGINVNLTTIDTVVEFLNNGIFHSTFIFQNADLPTIATPINNRIAQLQAINQLNIPSLVAGVNLNVSSVVSSLTAAQIAQNTFVQDYQLLQQAQRGVASGAILASASVFVALQNKVKGEFISSYLNLL